MLLNMKRILALLLLKSCMIAISSQNLPDVRKKMIQLLNLCFADNLKTVITTPDLGELFLETSGDFGPVPLVLIDENFKSTQTHHLLLHHATFVFAPYSLKSFDSMLLIMQTSPWWSVKSFFFIIGNSQDGCEPAAAIFKRIWEINLSSTLFLCYKKDEGMMLYTYNPFTHPPHDNLWRKIEDSDISDERWHLYVQPLLEGQPICTRLHYIKIKSLDKYERNHRPIEL